MLRATSSIHLFLARPFRASSTLTSLLLQRRDMSAGVVGVPLAGRVALVTGASRGIGRGIALQLGAAGAKVYVTGRRPEQQEAAVTQLQLRTDTLEGVAREITARGGQGVPVFCDHADPHSVQELFARVASENQGRLDILVNNAYAAVNFIFKNSFRKFYDLEPVHAWDVSNDVGLRNHYICSVHAARLMVPRASGLIVTVSSAGGMRHLFNTAYGIGKAACDRLAADTALDLLDAGVASVSLWPGAVKTELVQNRILDNPKSPTKTLFEQGETPEFAGKVIAELASDPEVLKLTGRILTTAAMAQKYNLTDIDGSQITPFPDIVNQYVDFVNRVRDPRIPSKM